MLLLTLSYSAVGYFQYLFFYWIKFYFQNNLELPIEDARWASFVVTMAMAVGMAVGGFGSDAVCRWFGDRWGRRLIAIGCMGLCAVFAYIGARSDDARHATVLFALSLGALGVCEGLFWTSATDLGGRLGGFAGAIMNTGGNGVSALAPVITPILAKHFGWESAIGVACAICALGGLMWLGIEPAASDTTES
jgi:MFS family permease